MKKILSLLLIISILVSCTSAKAQKEYKGEIIDGASRTVNIPVNNNETTIASVYAVSVPFIVALDLTDRVMAINAKSNFWYKANENLNNAGTVGRGTVDLEKLATYNPGVFIHRSNDPETVEAVERLGIDVICITVEDIDDVKNTLTMLGTYFDKEQKAKEVNNWIDTKIEYIEEIVKTIPDNEKKTAMLIGGELGRVAGNDMLQTWMIEKAGGIPVIDEGKDHDWINIGVEKVFTYNPDVIFCTSSTSRSYQIDELIADPTWSAVEAIKNKNIFVVPTANDSWDMPGISCVLGVMFMLHKMYPEYFPLDKLQTEVDEYYNFMFGKTFDEELDINWGEIR